MELIPDTAKVAKSLRLDRQYYYYDYYYLLKDHGNKMTPKDNWCTNRPEYHSTVI